MRVVDEVACVVGGVGPTRAGTCVRESGFASARVATKQHASSVLADAGGVQIGDDR